MKGLGFKHHGNHPCNHGSHYGNYHDNHSNHHGNYHAEQLLFSCQCSKVSSCRVVRLSSCQVRFLGTRDMLNKFLFLGPCSNLTVYRRSFFAHPLCASPSCLQYSISFGNKKPDNFDRDYIVLLSNLIEEGTVYCLLFTVY